MAGCRGGRRFCRGRSIGSEGRGEGSVSGTFGRKEIENCGGGEEG